MSTIRSDYRISLIEKLMKFRKRRGDTVAGMNVILSHKQILVWFIFIDEEQDLPSVWKSKFDSTTSNGSQSGIWHFPCHRFFLLPKRCFFFSGFELPGDQRWIWCADANEPSFPLPVDQRVTQLQDLWCRIGNFFSPKRQGKAVDRW